MFDVFLKICMLFLYIYFVNINRFFGFKGLHLDRYWIETHALEVSSRAKDTNTDRDTNI